MVYRGVLRFEGEAGFGEDVEAEVSASFGPFVGLFGQDRADEAGDGVAVGEDPDAVGAAADFAVEALVGVVRPDLGPEAVGEQVEREDVGSGGVEVFVRVRQLAVDVVQQPVELGVNSVGVGLVVNGMQHRFHCRPEGLRRHGHQVRGVVGSAALPAGAGQVRCDGLDQASVGVGSDQANPGEAAGDEVGEEGVPSRPGLTRRDSDAEDLTAPVSVDPGRYQHDGIDHSAAFTNFHGQGIGGDEGERSRVTQRAVSELIHVLVGLAALLWPDHGVLAREWRVNSWHPLPLVKMN